MAKHGKVKKYSKQHFVPQCYTKPWCDPTAPHGPKNTPFVWQFDPDGKNPRRKAPANLFTETDIYTIEAPDGERDLRLEHGFQDLEDKFTRIRKLRFERYQWPDAEQMAWLLAFVATAHGRTVGFRNFQRDQWRGIRVRAERMQVEMEKATPEERESMSRLSRLSSSKSGGMSIDDFRKLESQPIHELLDPTLRVVLPIYARMHVAVLCTDDPLGFVTTDSPVTWCNPEAYKPQPIFRSPGLTNRLIEVTLPVSPRQCLLVTHAPDCTGFIDVKVHTVDELNRRHIAQCDESFISCRNEARAVWFEDRPMPDDSWEKVRERKIASGEWS